MKPLMLVNGMPLIQHAVRHAVEDWHIHHLMTIVVSPENAALITQVVVNQHNFVIQPQPEGVVNAIRRALPFCQQEWTLILMADNTFDMKGLTLQSSELQPLAPFIGVREDLQWPESARFTRVKYRKIDVNTHNEPNKTVFSGGVELLNRNISDPGNAVWIGPLLLNTEALKLAAAVPVRDIEDLIMRATSNGTKLRPISLNCADLGIPEAL